MHSIKIRIKITQKEKILEKLGGTRMKEKEKSLKSNKAITLIALVITVIVLLILARSNSCHANR